MSRWRFRLLNERWRRDVCGGCGDSCVPPEKDDGKRSGYARGHEVLVSEGQDLPQRAPESQFHRLTVGSLFAGIGGFDLGLERAGFEVRWQVEIDPFCRAVLAKHWPQVKRYEDVRTVHGWRESDCIAHSSGGCERCLPRVDVLCGGFPCQDISVANTGPDAALGLDGARSGLWREFARLIGELRPRYVVVENSPALVIRGLDRVLADLAARGFDAQWTVVRASQFGARHRRERMLICAYANGDGLQGRDGGPVPNLTVPPLGDDADWPSISAPFGCRTADGIPDRVDRTHALGNAVCPQITEWLGRRILEAEERLTA